MVLPKKAIPVLNEVNQRIHDKLLQATQSVKLVDFVESCTHKLGLFISDYQFHGMQFGLRKLYALQSTKSTMTRVSCLK